MGDTASDQGFSADQQRTLASVLDEIIPPSDDGQLPGAGELGLVSYIEQALRQAPELRSVIEQGLAELDEVAQRRHGRHFSAVAKAEKIALLNEQGFVFPLAFQVYAGYYQHARVVEALGLEARPPHPHGYQMEPNDLSLLDGVRRRPKLYR
ncbi:MAG: gluconate 2-dehydrogenase subunit 3 family protein [Deltaproteobacteria bacterium]|nr:gluconate 2-dehydrogenase subunit 3 family protein [Deltaproteobacteria bacterium]